MARTKATSHQALARLVLDATNRKRGILDVVVRVHVHAVVVQAPVVSVVRNTLRGTPEERDDANVVEDAVVAVARGERRKVVRIRPVAAFIPVIIPAAGALEFCARHTVTAHRIFQCCPFVICRDVPPGRARALMRSGDHGGSRCRLIGTVNIHRRRPGVEPPILRAAIRAVVVAPAVTLEVRHRYAIRIVQILRHPRLRTNDHRFVALTITAVRYRVRPVGVRAEST